MAYFCLLVIVVSRSVGAKEVDRLSSYINDISQGPSVYYSPESALYYSGADNATITPEANSSEKEAALASFKAALLLGEMGPKAIDAIPILIKKYPKAVHIVKVESTSFSGEGTFEDWVQTYVTNEKNKFLLSSTFFDYNTMARCEHFVEASPKTASEGTPRRGAIVDLHITFTVHFGACALTRITGMNFGSDQYAWQQWWAQNGSNFSTSPIVSTGSVAKKGSLDEILVGGKYQIILNSGKEYEGTIESKNDTSLVIETAEGKPFLIRFSLIFSHELLQKPGISDDDFKKATVIPYDALLNHTATNVMLDVKIHNGTVFRGTLISVDEDMMKLEVDNSTIPIARDVVVQIQTVPKNSAPKKEKVKKRQGPKDTVVVKKPETDEQVTLVGYIVRENDKYIGMEQLDGKKKKIARSYISLIKRHSKNDYEMAIKTYAKDLKCPDNMVLVDIPPSSIGKPFFKVCVDKYEFPNKAGSLPKGNVSYEEAKKDCEKEGKRLCTAQEWQWACSGKDGKIYPYGNGYSKEKCNTNEKRPVASGNRIKCTSPFGINDMVGNVFEWVSGKNDEPKLMGGPYSKCQTVTSGVGGAKPQTGFRCCKSN